MATRQKQTLVAEKGQSSTVDTVLLERIEESMDMRIRPYIQMHGGDIEIIELTPETVLKVRLHGACVGCGASSITLEMGVQQMLFEEFPEEDIHLLHIQD
jgi:Fe-S cluster biogenesis protein NfuA